MVLKEHIRFSNTYNRFGICFRLALMFPITSTLLPVDKFKALTQGCFCCTDTRFFRLPFVPLFSRVFSRVPDLIWQASNWFINTVPWTTSYASTVVTKLRLRQFYMEPKLSRL